MKYSPAQPRTPAGQQGAGQWTDAPNGVELDPLDLILQISYDFGSLIAEVPYSGGRLCVYRFSFGDVIAEGPARFACPTWTTPAAVSHGILLNDNR
ncbi:hypothetical protein ABEG18_15205 [Alsobacter sp. KACC 23698]|uniref:Uncharacterized protein n=1 Tax=Alsobacter sp. KACC 23698 TaxID=3149229 RepID=A0AAU7J9N9_9HYPH